MVRRLAVAAAVVVLLLALPVLAGWLVGGRAGARACGIGALFALLLTVRSGWRHALVWLPVLAVVVLVSALVNGTVAWVALLAGLALIVGVGAARGWRSLACLMGVLASVTPPLGSGESPLLRVLLAAVAAGYVVLVLRLLGRPAVVEDERVDRATAAVAGALLALVVTVAAAGALVWGESYAHWLPALVFAMVIPVPGLPIPRAARQRVLGTVAGALVALVAGLLPLPGAARLGLAVVALLLCVAVITPLWLNAAFNTVVLGTVLAPTTEGVPAATLRVLDALLAAALVGAGMLALRWWAVSAQPEAEATGQALTEGLGMSTATAAAAS